MSVAIRRASHAVYDTSYHLVWAPKYRRAVLVGEVRLRVVELLHEIAFAYDVVIDELEVAEDHVHIFCSFPPRWSISQVVTRFKSLTARTIFREYPQVKRQFWGGEFWGGEFWEDGYFVRTVGDKVTSAIIRRYIRNHREEPNDNQLGLFEEP